MLLLSFFSFKLLDNTVDEGFHALFDTDGYSDAVFFAGFFALFSWQLWKSARDFGATLFGAVMPLDFMHKGHVDGVSQGNAVVSLTADAATWKFDHVHDKIHLSAFFASRRAEKFILLENTLAESHFLQVDDARYWLSNFRQNRKKVARSGWPLPIEDENMQHYDLPADVYFAAQARDKKNPPSNMTLWGPIIAFSVWAFIFVCIAISFVNSESFDIYQTGLFFIVALAVITVPAKIGRVVWIGWRRQRQGLTIDGRDYVGVTHGPTACSITPDGIDLHRTHYKQEIDWNAVQFVDLWGGWLAFRSGDQTLAIVPDVEKTRHCITKAGLQPPQGPWATTTALQTWARTT